MPKIKLDYDTIRNLQSTGDLPKSFSIDRWEEDRNRPARPPTPPPVPERERADLLEFAQYEFDTFAEDEDERNFFRGIANAYLAHKEYTIDWDKDTVLPDFENSVNCYYEKRETVYNAYIPEKENGKMGNESLLYVCDNTEDCDPWSEKVNEFMEENTHSTREFFCVADSFPFPDADAGTSNVEPGSYMSPEDKVADELFLRQYIVARIWEKCGFQVYMGFLSNYRDEYEVRTVKLPESAADAMQTSGCHDNWGPSTKYFYVMYK